MSLDTVEYANTRRELADWVRPTADENGGQQLFAALRSGAWLIALTVTLSVFGVSLYLQRADEVYESSADLLVSPAAGGEAGVPGVTLLRGSADPLRNIETVARLVTAPSVIRRMQADLRLRDTPGELREATDAAPVAESDVVTVTARASTPERAQQLANGLSAAAVAERTDALHRQLDDVIPRVRARLEETPDRPTRETLAARLADLQTLREMPDPTIRLASPAELSESPIAPRRRLSFIVALVGGLLVGVGGVLGLQLLNPRIVSDDQLRGRYRLPILARVRRSGRTAGSDFRSLRAALLARDQTGPGGRMVLVIAPSRLDARHCGFNLARSLADAGRSVLLAVTDDGRPAFARAHGGSNDGLVDVLRSRTTVAEAAVEVPELDGVSLLASGSGGDGLPDVLDTQAAHSLAEQSREVSEWLIVTSPPYAHAVDVLPLARLARHVVVAVHYGSTTTSELRRLTDLLGDHGIEPAGFVVLAARRTDVVG